MPKQLQVGDRAPDIALPDQDGETRRLAEQRGKWVLVYFYPRDDTPGCTVEACGLRDAAKDYAKAGIEVLGISADSAKSHRKFADKHALAFTLLADEEKRAIHAYGAWGEKKFMGRTFDGILRRSFLVDPQGKIAKIYPKVKPEAHAEEVLADVAALAGGPAPSSRAAATLKPAKKAATKPAGASRGTRKSKPKK
jgi:peroxiredoxin Q/BCP